LHQSFSLVLFVSTDSFENTCDFVRPELDLDLPCT
jgi:hypothetical protein